MSGDAVLIGICRSVRSSGSLVASRQGGWGFHGLDARIRLTWIGSDQSSVVVRPIGAGDLVVTVAGWHDWKSYEDVFNTLLVASACFLADCSCWVFVSNLVQWDRTH